MIVIDTAWLKFHVAVETEINQVMAFSLTEPSVHDSKKSMELVRKVLQASEKEDKKGDCPIIILSSPESIQIYRL